MFIIFSYVCNADEYDKEYGTIHINNISSCLSYCKIQARGSCHILSLKYLSRRIFETLFHNSAYVHEGTVLHKFLYIFVTLKCMYSYIKYYKSKVM